MPARLGTRDRAEDHFHLNDHGYRLVAEDFAAAIRNHARTALTGPGTGSPQETP